MACRFPAGIRSPEELWRLVAEGGEVLSGFPENRGWDLGSLFDDDPDTRGTSYVDKGAFLHDAGDFDAEFFGISPREALSMDPQQRLLLETSWETFERAGLDPASLRGSAVGVFTGIIGHDYTVPLRQAPTDIEGMRLTGTAGSVASGRVSYTLGLEGPAVTVDTACSSSLVAMHLAAQALRSGECSMALASGSMVMSTPDTFVEFSRQRGLARDGRVKAFAAGSDGTAWAEGVGVLLLERLSEARRHGHPVLALVRGTAVNQDGASNGLTAPNGPSQQRVIRAALANAGLTPADVDAVEAHGTGTTLGDPIEAQALLATYGQQRPGDDQPLWLGSLKSNLGHAQAAAGVASVIKMVQALAHEELPKTLHADEPTTKVDWTEGAVELLTESRPWPRGDRPRRAGVSSFGVSGTNAHVILEQAPEPEPAPEAAATDEPDGVVAWPISGHTPQALAGQAARLHAHVSEHPGTTPAQVAHGLLTTRSAFDHRAVVVGGDRGELLDGLAAFADGQPSARVVSGSVRPGGKTVFVFPGQGAQWAGMAADLIAAEPVFAQAIRDCEAALSGYADDWSLGDVLADPEGALLERVDVVQPALFAVMVSLARLWQHHGIRPDAVIGHSQGEIAAAHVAGALTLEGAAKVVCLRSQAIRALSGQGAMASVALPRTQVAEEIAAWQGKLSVAVVNSPTATVVSGDTDAVAAYLARCEEAGVRNRLLPVDYASHGPHVTALRDTLLSTLAGLEPGPAAIPFYSTVTGGVFDTTGLTADYWYTNLRESVRFHDTLTQLIADGHTTYVEASPHPTLTTAITDTATDTALTVTGTLRRHEHSPTQLRLALAQLHTHGAPVAWHQTPTAPAGLPTYAFQHQTYWPKAGNRPGDLSLLGLTGADHPLAGAWVGLSESDGVVGTGVLSLRTHPWLADHAVNGTTILPATAFAELAIRAGDETRTPTLDELVIETPLALTDGHDSVRIQVTVGPEYEEGRRAVTIHSAAYADSTAPWTRHATGTLTPATTPPPPAHTAWPPPGAQAVDLTDFYDRQLAAGLDYGPAFQGVRRLWTHEDAIYAEVALPDDVEPEGYALHPALLDAALHTTRELPAADNDEVTRLPFAWSRTAIHASGASALRVRATRSGADGLSLELADTTGAPVATIGELAMRAVSRDRFDAGRTAGRDSLFRVEWAPVAPPPAGAGGPDIPAVADAAALRALVASSGTSGSVPDLVLLDLATADSAEAADNGGPERVHALTERTLELLQVWVGEPALKDSRLVVVTHGAMSAPYDPAQAAVWGLVRTAQNEHPDRITLIDLDEYPVAHGTVRGLVGTGEPQLAIRRNTPEVPRLTRASVSTEPGNPAPDPEGTVLITGGTGTLARLTARHLVSHHDVRHLLLVSRRGPDAEGADDLATELTDLGAQVRIEACDVTDSTAVAALLTSIPDNHPLTGIIHTAGALDDAVIDSLTPQRLHAVLRPKADAAWHLHHHTRHHNLAFFLLYSSAAGTLGNPGQANYAAANTYLDALAHHRHTQGLPATSLAWGYWAETSAMTAHLDDTAHQRNKRDGMLGLTEHTGMALLDAALLSEHPVLVPARLDLPALRARQSANGQVSPLLRALIPPARRAARSATPSRSSLVDELAGRPADERSKLLTDLVLGHVSAVLGTANGSSIDAGRAFKEAGFDSLTSVELRNRLTEATGVRLPATLVFDHPTPAALVRLLEDELVVPDGGAPLPVLAELDRLEQALAGSAGADESVRQQVTQRLRKLSAHWDELRTASGTDDAPDLDAITDDEMFSLLDNELGQS
nr:type I polyketide synthase [Streptomyces phytophilus]